MCFGAFVLARVDRVVYGAPEPKTGAAESVMNASLLPLNHTFAVTRRVLEAECAYVIQEFFKRKRQIQN
jgi:tRNA(adenine34) deaminase